MKMMLKIAFVLSLTLLSLPLFAQPYRCRVKPPAWNEEKLTGYIQLRREDLDVMDHGIGRVRADDEVVIYRGVKTSELVKLAMTTFHTELKGRPVGWINFSESSERRYLGIRASTDLNPELEEPLDLIAYERNGQQMQQIPDSWVHNPIVKIYEDEKIPWQEEKIKILMTVGYSKYDCAFDEP